MKDLGMKKAKRRAKRMANTMAPPSEWIPIMAAKLIFDEAVDILASSHLGCEKRLSHHLHLAAYHF